MNHINSFFNKKDWEKVIEPLTNSINKSVITIGLDGETFHSSGEIPEYVNIISTTEKGKQFIKESRLSALKKLLHSDNKILLQYNLDGLSDIWAPIKLNNELVGAVGVPYLLDYNNKNSDYSFLLKDSNLEESELKESISKIKPVSQEELKKIGLILEYFINTIPKILEKQNLTKKRLNDLESVFKLTKQLNSSLDLDKIIINVLKHFHETYHTENCSIIIKDSNKKFHHKSSQGIEKIEEILTNEIENTKTRIIISDLSSDSRFRNITSSKISVLCYPLTVGRKHLGCIILYFNDIKKLTDEDYEKISIISDSVSIASFNASQYEKIKETANIDNLTGLYDRGFFKTQLEENLIDNITKEKPLTISLIDIDDFKFYNDTNGHVKGDELIKKVSNILKSEVRGIDVVGRYGGEEFIIIFPEVGNDIAFNILENIRKKIKSMDFPGLESQPQKKLTISAGLLTCMDNRLPYKKIIEEVDKALYKSKVEGKNRITSVMIVNHEIPSISLNDVNQESKKFKKNY